MGNRIGAIAIILRDCEGFCREVRTKTATTQTRDEMELLGIVEAIEWSISLGKLCTIVESSCSNIIKELNGEKNQLGWQAKSH